MPLVVDAIAQILRQEGVESLSCYPTTPVIDAAARSGIRPIVCRQERVGVGIADGFSRVAGGGRFGVFASQFGPGAENAFAGIASAYSDGVPILVLALGNNLDRAQVRPLFRSGPSYRPITKFFETIVRAQDAGEVMRRAVNALRNGPPGPVMVEIPKDIAVAEIPEDAIAYRTVTSAKSGAAPDDVDRAIEAILEAQNPVIVAGHGILQSEACNELAEFAELVSLPVITTLSGKSAIPESHPLSVGVASIVASDVVVNCLRAADLVVALGSGLTRHFLTAELPEEAAVVQLTLDERDLNKSYSVEYPLVGDAKVVLNQLLEAAGERNLEKRPARGEVADRIASGKRSWLSQWESKLNSDATPITPYRVIHEFMKATDPDHTIVTHDSGSPRDQIAPFYVSGQPNTYIGWGKSHALGGGLGLIMGAKIAAPEKFAVQFLGDAAFGMTGMDIETAVRAEIPVAWVVLNNSTMAIEIRTLIESHEQYGTRDIEGNYADIARALGVDARRVERPEELAPAFEYAKRTTEAGRPVLIEVITNAETAFANRYALSSP